METLYEESSGWSMVYNTKDSLYHGLYMVFNEDNNLIIMANYDCGKKHGLEHTWYENGVLMSIIKYDMGIVVESLKFDRKGIPKVA